MLNLLKLINNFPSYKSGIITVLLYLSNFHFPVSVSASVFLHHNTYRSSPNLFAKCPSPQKSTLAFLNNMAPYIATRNFMTNIGVYINFDPNSETRERG